MLGEKTKPQSLGNLLLDKSSANEKSINQKVLSFFLICLCIYFNAVQTFVPKNMQPFKIFF